MLKIKINCKKFTHKKVYTYNRYYINAILYNLINKENKTIVQTKDD